MQTITDNMVDRLHKKLVKLKLQHGADLNAWPNQITTTLFREGCYFAKLSLWRVCGRGWDNKIIWQNDAYNIQFSCAPGVTYANRSGPRVFNEYSRQCYNKHHRYAERLSSRWCGHGGLCLDIPKDGVAINSSGFIATLLNASRVMIRTGLANSCVPDIYVKRGDTLAFREHMCQHDRYLIDTWKDEEVESTLRSISESEYYKRVYSNRIQEVNQAYAGAIEKLSQIHGG